MISLYSLLKVLNYLNGEHCRHKHTSDIPSNDL